jgi:hypothetical protein
MGEYVAPFNSIEGFIASPDTELNELLTVLQEKTSSTDEDTQVSLLKDLVSQSRLSLDDMIRTAKQLNPVIQKISPIGEAYDSAFEHKEPMGVPRAGATLQGFALLLLVISYISLIIVSVIAVNIMTGNLMSAGKVLIALLALGIVGYAILMRFG